MNVEWKKFHSSFFTKCLSPTLRLGYCVAWQSLLIDFFTVQDGSYENDICK